MLTFVNDTPVNPANLNLLLQKESGLALISSTAVDFSGTGATTLYTVPASKLFVPAFAAIRSGADAGETDITFGRSTALTDWLDTIQLDNLDADGDQLKVEVTNATPPAKSKTYAAGVIFQCDVTVAQGGESNKIDLFGYLIDV